MIQHFSRNGLMMCGQVFSLGVEPWNVAITQNVVLMGLGGRNSLEDVVNR